MTTNIKFLKAGALLAYPVGYLFLRFFIGFAYDPILMSIMSFVYALIFIGWNEIVLRGRGKTSSREGKFWYAIILGIAATMWASPDIGISMLAMMAVAAYAVSAAGDSLFDNGDGTLLSHDLLHTFFIKPFSGFVSIFNVPAEVKNYNAQNNTTKRKGSVLIGIGALGVMAVLILFALGFLCNTDYEFSQFIGRMMSFDIETFKYFMGLFARLILATPITLYLYGLVSNSSFIHEPGLEAKRESLRADQKKLHMAPTGFIIASLVAFIALYILFFVIHASSIFGCLINKVPDGMLISEYAREGFFSLIAIMIINMIVYRTALLFAMRDKDENVSVVVRILLAVLMVISLIFALLSCGRLVMYFARYGFTPLRMLAIWGTLVMSIYSVMAIRVNQIKMRAWLKLAAVGFIVVSLASGILELVL